MIRCLKSTTCLLIAFLASACSENQMDSDIIELPVLELQKLLASGELSASALTGAFLQRIDALDDRGPTLNAIIETNSLAIEQAQALDDALGKNGPVGVLHGLPVILKAV